MMKTDTENLDLAYPSLFQASSGFNKYLYYKSRPSYIGIPRKRLDLQFSVQLMRSSYNTIDDLDFIPMDVFQRLFFLFRQNEWEDYKNYYGNAIMQGDLADPLYFDFISFCQYAVISDRIRFGQVEFMERVGAEGEVQRVIRNVTMRNNDMLPAIHSEIVGDKLLTYIQETYRSVSSLQSLSESKNIDQFLTVAKDVLDIFAINSFALNPSIVRLSTDENTFKVSLKAPANLWSQQVLRYRRDNPVNDFENKVLAALSRKLNLKYKVLRSDVTNSIDVSHIVKLDV